MGYPQTKYREPRSPAAREGFQTPSAANNNVRFPKGMPANTNRIQRPAFGKRLPVKPELPQPKHFGRSLAGKIALRGAARLIPVLGTILLVKDVYDLLSAVMAISYPGLITPPAGGINCGQGNRGPYQGPGFADCLPKGGSLSAGQGYQKFDTHWVYHTRKYPHPTDPLFQGQGNSYRMNTPVPHRAPITNVGNTPYLKPNPRVFPRPIGWFIPALAPGALPILQPTPVPVPVPYPLIPKRIFEPEGYPQPQHSTKGPMPAPSSPGTGTVYLTPPVPTVSPMPGNPVPASQSTSATPEVSRPTSPSRPRIVRNPFSDPSQKPNPGVGPVPGVVFIPLAPPTGVKTTEEPAPIEFMPGAARPLPGKHESQPPGPGTKERKVRMVVGAGATILTGFGILTEYIDLLDSLYGAIPKPLVKREMSRLKKNRLSVEEKGRLVYKHAADIDIEQAIKNVLIDNIQDVIIGKLSGGTNANLKRRFGLDAGIGRT